MEALDARVASLAEAQHGVFTARQADALKMKAEDRRYLVRTGRWREVHQGVYSVTGAPLTWQGRLLAAVWAGGPRGRASHRSAAALWGLPGGRVDLVELTCPRWRRTRHGGLLVHETTAFEASDSTTVDRIPVTTCDCTLLDLAGVVGCRTVEYALDDALRRSLVTIDSVRATLRRRGRRGRNGSGVLRTILAERAPGRPPESPPERDMVRMLVRNGLPEPVLQFDVHDEQGEFIGRVDAAYPQWRIAIEYESFEHHTGAQALVRDNARRNRFRIAGWEYVGITATDLRNGSALPAKTIRAARDRFGVTSR